MKRDAFRYESFYASASTDGERLYTIARSGKIVTLDASSGRILWTDNVNSLGYSTPAVGRDRIFVGDFNGGLRAYGKRNGRLLWRSYVGGRILGAPGDRGRPRLLLDARDGDVRRRGVSDGKVVWRYGLGKYSPGIATERTYYFSLNGMLVAFRGRDAPRSARPKGTAGRTTVPDTVVCQGQTRHLRAGVSTGTTSAPTREAPIAVDNGLGIEPRRRALPVQRCQAPGCRTRCRRRQSGERCVTAPTRAPRAVFAR